MLQPAVCILCADVVTVVLVAGIHRTKDSTCLAVADRDNSAFPGGHLLD